MTVMLSKEMDFHILFVKLTYMYVLFAAATKGVCNLKARYDCYFYKLLFVHFPFGKSGVFCIIVYTQKDNLSKR